MAISKHIPVTTLWDFKSICPAAQELMERFRAIENRKQKTAYKNKRKVA